MKLTFFSMYWFWLKLLRVIITLTKLYSVKVTNFNGLLWPWTLTCDLQKSIRDATSQTLTTCKILYFCTQWIDKWLNWHMKMCQFHKESLLWHGNFYFFSMCTSTRQTFWCKLLRAVINIEEVMLSQNFPYWWLTVTLIFDMWTQWTFFYVQFIKVDILVQVAKGSH